MSNGKIYLPDIAKKKINFPVEYGRHTCPKEILQSFHHRLYPMCYALSRIIVASPLWNVNAIERYISFLPANNI